MANYNATVLTLHRNNVGETDRILTLFARESGKFSAIAKGARKPTSRLAGATEPFTVSRMQLGAGRNLDIVTQSEIVQSYPELRGTLGGLARASYLCELLDRMTAEHDATVSDELFDLTTGSLELLQRPTDYPDGVLHTFELRLLAVQGYEPALHQCARCGGALVGRLFGFSPSLGGVLCTMDRFRAEDSTAISLPGLQLLRSLAAGEEAPLPTPAVAAETARALRWYISYRTDRQIKSAEFLDQLRAGAQPA